MKRYIKPSIETIVMPSLLLLDTSYEEGSQVDGAMSNGHDGEFETDMEESTSLWLKSNSMWNDDSKK